MSKFIIKNLFGLQNVSTRDFSPTVANSRVMGEVQKGAFQLPKPWEAQESEKFTLPEPAKESINVNISYLGTPVFAPLTFKEGSYKVGDKTIRYQGLDLQTVLMDISMSKNIVKTAVQGRSGTVKEYIADGDYQVNIRGILASIAPKAYPEEAMNKLLTLCKVPDALAVVSPLLTLFGIYHLVIESYSLPATQGYQNIQAFELTCVSDESIEVGIDAEL